MKQIMPLFIFLGLMPMASSFAEDSKPKSLMEQMDISVRDVSGLRSLRPVTGGIPLTQGAAPDGASFVLYNDRDKPVPSQTLILLIIVILEFIYIMKTIIRSSQT